MLSVIWLLAAATPLTALAQKILPPPDGFIYHSAFPDFGGPEDRVTEKRITDFESLAKKRIVWAYFSNNWKKRIKFPSKAIQTIYSHGTIPFVRLMARTNFDERPRRDTKYRLRKIIRGKFDKQLIAWAKKAKASNIPIMIEFGTEVNGFWFPWNAKWNGRRHKKKYGDPDKYDGAERFVDAYRHIVNIFRSENVQNVTWVFHVNARSFPKKVWNEMQRYYPGDDFVDWIGVSVYGALDSNSEWESFTEVLDEAYPKLAAISATKPLAILEFGVDERPLEPGKKAEWIADAFKAITSNRYPRIKAISYWHENWPNSSGTKTKLRIDSSPSALKAYQDGVANDMFTSVVYLGN
ncbi:MAG: hypothetical protein D6780_00650 [Candidatus Dadabacteria bacterium]|nr:MAG: hypothetical protein D6780_00650 [Candidatus Dadabacteria bacterium]